MTPAVTTLVWPNHDPSGEAACCLGDRALSPGVAVRMKQRMAVSSRIGLPPSGRLAGIGALHAA